MKAGSREARRDPHRPRALTIRHIVGWTLAVCGTAYLVWKLHAQWDDLRTVDWHVGWLTILAVPAVMAGQWLVGLTVATCLAYTRARPSTGRVVGIYLISQAAKYLPAGGVLNISTQTVLLSRLDGVTVKASVFGVGAALAIVISSAVSAFGLASFADPDAGVYSRLAVLALPAALAALRSAWFWAIAARVLRRRTGDTSAAERRRPPFRVTVLLALQGLATWVLLGGSLALIAAENTPVSPMTAVRLCGLMAASWVVGVVSIGVPAGIGVRDSFLMILLQRVLPNPWPVAIPVISRLVWVVADLANLVPGLLLHRARGMASKDGTP